MKKFRLSFALLLLALVLAAVPAALAQDETFGLSQSDYDLWTSANANLATIDTASYDFTATLSAANLGDSDVSANLHGTGVLDTNSDNPQFQLDLTGTITQGDQSTDINAALRIVDGYIYFNDATSDSGWQGSKLEDAMNEFSTMFGQGLAASGTDINPSDIEKGDLSGLTDMAGVGDAMSALSDLNPADFVSLVRSDASGQALFTLNFDIGKLLASPAMAPLLAGSMSGGDTSQMSDAQVQQMGAMMGAMFSTSTISFDEYVDTGSSMISRAALNISIPLDAMMGAGAGVTLSFDISLSDLGQPVSVEAPADATITDMSSGS